MKLLARFPHPPPRCRSVPILPHLHLHLLRRRRSCGAAPLLAQGPSPVSCRGYATHKTVGAAPGAAGSTSAARRKAVTPLNDDGHVPWSELSVAEKAGRATQHTVNYGLILVGLILTAGAGYFVYADVLSPDSKTAHFNRAVDRVKRSRQCVEILGDANKTTAHGDNSWSRWSRNRQVASTTTTDSRGNEHLAMRFYLEGPLGTAEAHAHLVRAAGQQEYRYRYLYLDSPGHARIWLENADTERAMRGKRKNALELFGLKLG